MNKIIKFKKKKNDNKSIVPIAKPTDTALSIVNNVSVLDYLVGNLPDSVKKIYNDLDEKEVQQSISAFISGFAGIIGTCDPSKCNFTSSCVFKRRNDVPAGFFCPMEVSFVKHKITEYYNYHNTDGDRLLELKINELVGIELIINRMNSILSRDGLIILSNDMINNVEGFGAGEIITNSKENPILKPYFEMIKLKSKIENEITGYIERNSKNADIIKEINKHINKPGDKFNKGDVHAAVQVNMYTGSGKSKSIEIVHADKNTNKIFDKTEPLEVVYEEVTPNMEVTNNKEYLHSMLDQLNQMIDSEESDDDAEEEMTKITDI